MAGDSGTTWSRPAAAVSASAMTSARLAPARRSTNEAAEAGEAAGGSSGQYTQGYTAPNARAPHASAAMMSASRETDREIGFKTRMVRLPARRSSAPNDRSEGGKPDATFGFETGSRIRHG